MNFEGKATVSAPASKVWDFLLDVDRFATCVPGVEEVKRIDERTFEGALSAAVGPISGSFTFRAFIVASRPPSEMLARLEGSDSVTRSKLNGDIQIVLTEPAGGDSRTGAAPFAEGGLSPSPSPRPRTELAYRAKVTVEGRLAIVGDMILRTTASLLIEEFLRRLRARIEGVE